MVAARKEKKVKLVWEELKNGGPFRKLFLVGAEYLLIYGVVKEMYEKIVLHEDVAIQLIIYNYQSLPFTSIFFLNTKPISRMFRRQYHFLFGERDMCINLGRSNRTVS